MEALSNRIDRLAPPPRRVPVALACSAMTNIFGIFGAIFFSFGMIFVWVFTIGQHPIDDLRLAYFYDTSQAIVEQVHGTNAYENEQQVYEYTFSFQVGNGGPFRGRCYTTGQNWGRGEHVPVHYLPGNPEVASLVGARLSNFPFWVIFLVAIFPIVGLAFFIPPTVAGVHKVKLLIYGVVTGTESVKAVPSNVEVNGVTVMNYTYKFRDQQGMLQYGSSKALPTEKIGDETREPVLYLPKNPQTSMLVDALSLDYPLEVGESGRWQYRGPVKPVLIFLLVWSAVLVHVGILILKIL